MTTRVLLCDDVRDVRFMLRMILERTSELQVVGEASSGPDVIDSARRLQPDLVVLDVSMPGMDGVSALRTLRSVAPNTRIVLLTGMDARDLRDAGADDVIQKGVHAEELVERLRDVAALVRAGFPTTEPAAGARWPALVPRAALTATLRIVPGAAVAFESSGCVVASNERALELFGLSPPELLGRAVHTLLSTASAHGTDDVDRFLAADPARPPSRPLSLHARHANGTEFPADVSLAPIECEDAVLLVATFTDTTERVRARQMRERLASIVESSDDAIYSLDADGRIRTWNHGAERLYGYSTGEAIGRHASSLVPRSGRDEDRTLFTRVLAGDSVRRQETIRTTKHGTPVVVSLSASPLLDELGKIVGVSAIARDVTDQRRAAQALERAYEREVEAATRLRELDELKNAFLRSLSHDLRSPTAVITGMADLVLGHNPDLHLRDRRALELIVRSGERLNRVMGDLLDVDRFTRGGIQALRQHTDVVQVCRKVLANLEYELSGRDVVLDAPASVRALVDPTQTERIVENLVANAVRHARTNTPIAIRVQAQGTGVLIAVEDEGPGIPDERKKMIFDLFTTLDPSGHGTGVGLHLVAQFAQLNGGRAWVEDARAGGSSFRVLLPALR